MRLSSIKRTLMSIGADTMRIMTALIKKRILHVSDIEDVSIKESEKIVDQRILIRIDKEEREENDREEQDL